MKPISFNIEHRSKIGGLVMSSILGIIAYIVILMAIVALISFGGRKYVFSKVKVNKWILLTVSVVLLILQMFMKIENPWITMLITLVIVTAFLWFVDIQSNGGPKKQEKKIVIRPKAKPNRVKHLKKDDKK